MSDTELEQRIEEAADLVVSAGRIVVFTGAGVSTESGIPDFRSPGGIWDRFDPDEFTYERFLTSPEARSKFWQLFRDRTFRSARPNAAHFAIVELERMGKLDCVITQNIDNLHQEAGSSPDRVIELHGTMKYAKCLGCGKRYPREEIELLLDQGIDTPRCDECNGLLKAATISFGEPMPLRETSEAQRRSSQCDLFIAIGSSLVVYPAADMPRYAYEAGARLILVNLDSTHLDSCADVVVRGKAGEALSRIIERVKAKFGD
ncbi:MAG: NAD-dependent deacylase [Dehalococcoidia bacterium]|nr:NAD-dependent deacylase [Dehalococcoidia bacterium]